MIQINELNTIKQLTGFSLKSLFHRLNGRNNFICSRLATRFSCACFFWDPKPKSSIFQVTNRPNFRSLGLNYVTTWNTQVKQQL